MACEVKPLPSTPLFSFRFKGCGRTLQRFPPWIHLIADKVLCWTRYLHKPEAAPFAEEKGSCCPSIPPTPPLSPQTAPLAQGTCTCCPSVPLSPPRKVLERWHTRIIVELGHSGQPKTIIVSFPPGSFLHATVYDLNMLIFFSTGIHANIQLLTYAKRSLQSHQSLSSYGVTAGSSVRCDIRARGGGSRNEDSDEEMEYLDQAEDGPSLPPHLNAMLNSIMNNEQPLIPPGAIESIANPPPVLPAPLDNAKLQMLQVMVAAVVAAQGKAKAFTELEASLKMHRFNHAAYEELKNFMRINQFSMTKVSNHTPSFQFFSILYSLMLTDCGGLLRQERQKRARKIHPDGHSKCLQAHCC